MKELNEIVVVKTKEMINDGTIEAMIAESLKKTISESISNALRSYSDFGKAISEKVEASLQCSSRHVKLPEYNVFIKEIVEEQFSLVLREEAVSHLSSLIEGVVKPVTKNAKFSDILNFVQEYWTECAREAGNDEIAIESSENDNGTSITAVFKHPEYDWEDVRVTFYKFSSDEFWHIGYINQDGLSSAGINTSRITNKARAGSTKVTDMLFKYYAMQTHFEADQELESIYTSEY